MSKPPPSSKRSPLKREQIAKALAEARRICPWCAPHFRAKIEGRSGGHTRCDDFSCGCHCQDGRIVN